MRIMSHPPADSAEAVTTPPPANGIGNGEPSPPATEAARPAAQPQVETESVQPAKIIRIESMVRHLLDEVRSGTLDEAARTRLREIHESSIREVAGAVSPDLSSELERVTSRFSGAAPTAPELRVAEAQLVGWLEGLSHGIQAAIFVQEYEAEEERRRLTERSSERPPEISGAYL